MAITTTEKSSIHDMRAALKTRLDRMEQINDAAIVESRSLSPQEDQEYRHLTGEADQLDAMIRRELQKYGAEGGEEKYDVFPLAPDTRNAPRIHSERDESPGTFARAIEEAGLNIHERRKVTIDLRSTFPDIGNWSPRRLEGIQALGQDDRFLWPFLPSQDIGSDTRIDDFRQNGDRTVTGTIERDLGATTEKADLDVSIAFVSEKVKTFAVTIDDIPNQVLESAASARQFFETEARYQINQALDAHVMAQIMAANPPAGDTGANLIEQLRYAIAAMRLTGNRARLAVVNPTDAAELDLFQHGTDSATYMFPSRTAGVASPLWGLQLIEHATPTMADVPMLLDPERLGRFYLGSMDIMADPFTGFKTNTTSLRFELNAYMHVRDANAAYTIEAEVGDGDGGPGDGDGDGSPGDGDGDA